MTVMGERRSGWAFSTPPSPEATGRSADPDHWYSTGKAVSDLILATCLLVLLFPVILLSMVVVRLTSPGPAIYRQVRVGRRGREFVIYKIRSMYVDAEARTGPVWAKLTGDDRVTPVGAFLRFTHLDELPQLWNVIRGDMSLVGPRPERPMIIAKIEQALPRYGERLAVRPGVTGLAQFQLGPDTCMESVRRKLACDLYYIDRRSGLLDYVLIIGTFLSIMGIPYPWTRWILRIPTVEVAENVIQLDPPLPVPSESHADTPQPLGAHSGT